MSFSSLGLHADLLRGVQDACYTSPTPIQRDSIPAGLSGKDILACSATGSGKTAAFLLPILQKLILDPKPGVTRALILTPTRELASQIGDNLKNLARHTRISGATVVGGVGMGAQRTALQRGVPIVVATPGRLMDHLRSSYTKLGNVDMLVLDEADRMLDMGFLPDIKQIVSHLPSQRQTFFFSATLPPEIVSLTRQWLKDPLRINIERQSRPAEGINQKMYPVSHSLKASLLTHLLKNEAMRSVLVFTRTKRRADRVADLLKAGDVNATRIHGDRTQGQRTQAMEGFKKGRYQVLVATDVAARGIDVNALSHVINFDLPGSSEDYIHRIGRTARAQATGDAFTFVAPDEERDWKSIERVVGKPVERVKVADFDYSAAPTASLGHGGSSEGGERSQRNRGPYRERERGTFGSGGDRGRPSYGGRSEGRGEPRREWQRDTKRSPSAYREPSAQRSSFGPPSAESRPAQARFTPGAGRPASRFGAAGAERSHDESTGNRPESARPAESEVNGNSTSYEQRAPRSPAPYRDNRGGDRGGFRGDRPQGGGFRGGRPQSSDRGASYPRSTGSSDSRSPRPYGDRPASSEGFRAPRSEAGAAPAGRIGGGERPWQKPSWKAKTSKPRTGPSSY